MAAFKRATDKELATYATAMVRALVEGKPPAKRKWLRSEIADVAGIDKGRVTQLMAGALSGPKVQNGIALILDLSPDQFHAAARNWSKDHAEEAAKLVAGHEKLEHLERYENRVLAAEVGRREGVSEAAIKEVLSWSLKASSDPSVLDWLEDMKAEDRRLARATVPGRRYESAAEESSKERSARIKKR